MKFYEISDWSTASTSFTFRKISVLYAQISEYYNIFQKYLNHVQDIAVCVNLFRPEMEILSISVPSSQEY